MLTHLDGFQDAKRLKKAKKALKVGSAGLVCGLRGAAPSRAGADGAGADGAAPTGLGCRGRAPGRPQLADRGCWGSGVERHGPRARGATETLGSEPRPRPTRPQKLTSRCPETGTIARQARFWSEVYDGAKLFYLSGMQHGKYLKREVSLTGV